MSCSAVPMRCDAVMVMVFVFLYVDYPVDCRLSISDGVLLCVVVLVEAVSAFDVVMCDT